jgi:hypothetical protein
MTLANKVLMIVPEHFNMNPETAADNYFVQNISADPAEIRRQAKREFEDLKSNLERAGIEVVALCPSYSAPVPDAVFPNNWFSTHPDKTLVFYPMMSPSRRTERHPEIIRFLK